MTVILQQFLLMNNLRVNHIIQIVIYFRQMINQKIVQRALYGLQKGLQVVYFFGSLWISLLFVCTIPIWAPLYLLTASMCRSLSFMKRVLDLPQQLFRPQLTEPIRYAILKGNGKYLRNAVEQDAFLYQLYDYTLRKFLGIQAINPQTKIAEVESQTLSQWRYFKTNGIANIECLQSKPQILEKQRQSSPGIQIKKQTYQLQEFSNQYDTMIALNLKQKLNKHSNRAQGQPKIDLLKVLGYIKHHLSDKGYAIFGDFFQEQGEMSVMQELFQVYGFKVQQSENIQKNISYAQKILSHQVKKYWQEEILDKLVRKLKQLTGLKRDYSKKFFMVYILSKNANKTNEIIL